MGLKKINLFLLAGFYIIAGLNHFINPEFYLDLIPTYLPFHETINVGSGIAEVLLGIGVLFEKTRKWSSYLLVVMLIAFIPAHVYFLQIGSCIKGGLCAPEWVGWVRLIVFHPFLIWWAISVNSIDKRKHLFED